jgi:hypothetical protein|tara:strand:- start:270 stop:980 length:711 start_codon:yes stop_codon:yes gene_type:complete
MNEKMSLIERKAIEWAIRNGYSFTEREYNKDKLEKWKKIQKLESDIRGFTKWNYNPFNKEDIESIKDELATYTRSIFIPTGIAEYTAFFDDNYDNPKEAIEKAFEEGKNPADSLNIWHGSNLYLDSDNRNILDRKYNAKVILDISDNSDTGLQVPSIEFNPKIYESNNPIYNAIFQFLRHPTDEQFEKKLGFSPLDAIYMKKIKDFYNPSDEKILNKFFNAVDGMIKGTLRSEDSK